MQQPFRTRLPNFLVIGAQKCGTTSLCDALGRHPDVFMAEPKEPHFFSVDELYAKGLEWYGGLFSGVRGESAIGEGSTSYTMQVHRPETAGRIARHLPKARLIYIVRHPMRRMESGYMHLRFTGRTRSSFAKALDRFPHLVDTSLYWKQIHSYRKNYPDDQIAIVFFEDFLQDPATVLGRLFRFLDVDPDVFDPEWLRKKNVSVGRSFEKPLLVRARNHPFYDSASRLVPRWIKRPIKSMFTDSIRKRPSMDSGKKAEWVDRIRRDTLEMLCFCGKPRNFWDLDA